MNLLSIFTRVIAPFRSPKAAACRTEERRTSLKVEQLEQREVLSGFGGGWNIPSTFHWPMGHLPAETRVLAGTALANRGLANMAGNLATQGQRATANSLLNLPQFQQNLLQSDPLGRTVAGLTATASTAQAIYMDPLVNAMIQRDPTAVFLAGSGFTPQTWQRVTNQINALPDTRGSMIDYVNTTRMAGLDGRVNPEGTRVNLVPTMQTIQYGPGAAFAYGDPYASRLGITPTWTPATASSLGGLLRTFGMSLPFLP